MTTEEDKKEIEIFWKKTIDEHRCNCKCFKEGKSQAKKEILELINSESDKGNVVGGGFSAGLFLSKLIKHLEGKQ